LLILRQWMNGTRPILGLLISLFVTIIVTVSALGVTNKGRMALKDFKQLFALLSRRDGARPASVVDPGVPSSQLAT